MSDQAVEQSPEDRLLAFVEGEDQQQDGDLPSRFPEIEAEEKVEGEEETKNEETKEQRLLRLKHEGVEIEKPEVEVIALAQQGFDYTQKTQRLAEERKQVEEFAQTLKAQEQAFAQQVQVQSALTQDIAKVSAIDLQISQYQSIDWQTLSNTDPVQAQKLFFAYTQLQTERGQAVAEVTKKQQEFSQIQNQSRAKQIELGKQVLEKEIPGWGPELAKSLAEAGKSYGFTEGELSNLTDPRAVKLLHDAAQWRKLQSSKVVDKKVATASPTVKPGAKNNQNAANASTKADREALRKTGKSDYAAKLIERML